MIDVAPCILIKEKVTRPVYDAVHSVISPELSDVLYIGITRETNNRLLADIKRNLVFLLRS